VGRLSRQTHDRFGGSYGLPSERGNCTIPLAGDTMLTRKLTPFKEECFLKLREVLRRADASFTNRRSWRRENPGRRGRPVLGEGEVAKGVIERVARLSLPYGTKVTARNWMGLLRSNHL